MAREQPLRVHVLALRDSAPIVPVGLFDLLRKSIILASMTPTAAPRRPVEISLVSSGKTRMVKAAGGLTLHCDATLRLQVGPT